MKEKIDFYKKISLELRELLKNKELDIIDEKLEQREAILKDLDDINEFRKLANENQVIDLETEIYHLFNIRVNEAKQELIDYKKSKEANNTYKNLSKEKLNIFNKKV